MADMLESIDLSIIFAAAGLVVALGGAIWIFFTQRKLKLLFRGKRGKDLEASFLDMAAMVKELEKRVQTSEEALSVIQARLQDVLQKVGIIRFNPFEDAGGDQSFAIALLDEKNNGVVFS